MSHTRRISAFIIGGASTFVALAAANYNAAPEGSMFKTIAIVVIVLLAALLVFAATRPDDFSVRRATSIKAPPERIFPYLNDFHSFCVWSPYEKLDPTMKRIYSGPAHGKGAVYAWEGANGKAGTGRLEITDASAPSNVMMKLDFVKPFAAHNVIEFTLVPQGDATNVTWAMQGPMPYVSKLMNVFINMDTMIGKDFEKGLAELKSIAERTTPAEAQVSQAQGATA